MLIFLVLNVSASCDKDQIDINSASLENMMKIKGLGGEGIIAQRVIDARPFDSLDDLIKVNGIGEKTLEKIKDQNLACVANSQEDEEIEEEPEEEIPVKNETKEDEETNENENLNNQTEDEQNKTSERGKENKNYYIYGEKSESIQKTNREIINLTKDIKTEEYKEISDKNNFAIYGLMFFCFLLLFLFISKRKSRFNKNEFR